jgi:hypothetical protein
MDLYLALRLRYSDRAQDLRERLQQRTHHDICELLEIYNIELIKSTCKLWTWFGGPEEHLRDIIRGGILHYLPNFDRISHADTEWVAGEIVKTMGEIYNELHDQLDPLVKVLGLDLTKGIHARVDGSNLYLEIHP